MNSFTFFVIWSFMSAPTPEFKIKTLPRQEQKFVKNVLKMHKWETLSDICLTDKGIMMESLTPEQRQSIYQKAKQVEKSARKIVKGT